MATRLVTGLRLRLGCALLAVPLVGTLAGGSFLLWARQPRPTAAWEGLRRFAGAPAAPATPPAGLRVMTFNIAYGRGPQDDAGDLRSREHVERQLAGIAAAIRQSGADLVLLQEVDLDARRTHRVDQVAWLARATQLGHTATAITWNCRYVPYPLWPPTQHYGPLLSGQAVLSRFPLLAQQTTALPQPAANPFWYNWFYLTRTYQQVQLALAPGHVVTVANLHLEAFDLPNRERQATLVVELLRHASPRPLLFGGDFNTVPPEAPLRRGFPDEPQTDMDGDQTLPRLRQALPGWQDVFAAADYARPAAGHFTFPAEAPNRKLDFLFHDTRRTTRLAAAVLDPRPPCSDHRPLFAELRYEVGR